MCVCEWWFRVLFTHHAHQTQTNQQSISQRRFLFNNKKNRSFCSIAFFFIVKRVIIGWLRWRCVGKSIHNCWCHIVDYGLLYATMFLLFDGISIIYYTLSGSNKIHCFGRTVMQECVFVLIFSVRANDNAEWVSFGCDWGIEVILHFFFVLFFFGSSIPLACDH